MEQVRNETIALPIKISAQIYRFLIVGLSTVTLDMVILYSMVEFLSIHYLISAAVAFLVASVTNYFLSIRFVFYQGRYSHQSIEFTFFLVFTGAGLILNQLVMYSLTDLAKVEYLLSKFAALVLVTSFNFITKKYFVFKK